LNIFRNLTAFFLLALPLHAKDAPPLAKLVTVTSTDTHITRQFFGHVVAKQTVDLAFQVGGQIVEFPVLEGTPVTAGEMIAQLDLVPFQLALEQAEAQKAQADRTLERLQRLEGSTVSQVTVDDAVTQAELADIAVRNASRQLEQATLNAPFDGLVASRNVANFTTIGAGSPVVRLHDMSELRVEIEVPEVLFQRAGADPDVEIWATFPTSSKRFALEPREFDAETSNVGQTFRITLGMEQPEGLLALPGSSVTVGARLNGAGPSRITVPRAAIATASDGSTRAMVFEPAGAPEGTVRAVPVEITPTDTGAVAVTAGLEDGQEIVASGAALLEDGQAVRRFQGFAE
jgi:RND family efflux transporter MFP subunit